jgi:23S rRNA pseudouridine2605 synthase
MKTRFGKGPHERRKGKNEISLARAISKFGVASRSQGRAMITGGEVTVNGVVTQNPDAWIDPRRDTIAIGGNRVQARPFVYLALNKPAGVVTTRSDERGRPTVYTLLPADMQWVFPVGRLDMESSGLLIITNDTAFGERLTSPRAKLPKVYEVRLDRPLEESDAATLRKGMTAGGVQYRPVEADRIGNDPLAVRVSLSEGKNRQIRKMLAALGYDVLLLRRVSIGTLALGTLAPGSVRSLTPDEVTALGGRSTKGDRS